MDWKELKIKLLVIAIDNNLILRYLDNGVVLEIDKNLIEFIEDQREFNNKQLEKLITMIKERKSNTDIT